ncbi:MAG: hypothetical protein V2A79_19740, partial [Planctomycetota bacterium]
MGSKHSRDLFFFLHSPFSILHFGRWFLTAVLVLAASGCASGPTRVEPVYFPPPPGAPHVVHLKSFNSLDALMPVRRSWVELFRGAAPSPHVRTPAGLAFRDGRLYICDTGFNVVHRWDIQT